MSDKFEWLTATYSPLKGLCSSFTCTGSHTNGSKLPSRVLAYHRKHFTISVLPKDTLTYRQEKVKLEPQTTIE